MARKTLIFTLIAIAAVFSILYVKAHQTVSTAQLEALKSRPGVKVTSSPNPNRNSSTHSDILPPVKGQRTNASMIKKEFQDEVQRLQAELNSRRQSLQERSQNLQELRTEGTNPASEDGGASSSADLQSRDDEVQSLSASLTEMRENREALRQQEETAIAVRENASNAALSQLDAQIQQAEEAHTATRLQLEQFNRDHYFPKVTNVELETQLAQRQEAVETLRAQRLELTNSMHAEANQILSLSQQARSDLRAQEQEVRSQIFSLQNEIRRVQRSQTQERMSRQSQASTVQQAQRALASEAEQIRALEELLESKNAELRKLR